MISRLPITTPEQLRLTREKLKLTRAELAEALGMTRNAVLKMERGERPITRVTELAIQHLSCRVQQNLRTLR